MSILALANRESGLSYFNNKAVASALCHQLRISKSVPFDVVTDQTNATYVLKSLPVEVKSESTGERLHIACWRIVRGQGNVSVRLIEISWAYSVHKQKGGSKNQPSMAEAIAKQSKEFLDKK